MRTLFCLSKSKCEGQIVSIIEKVIVIVMVTILGNPSVSNRNCNHYNIC